MARKVIGCWCERGKSQVPASRKLVTGSVVSAVDCEVLGWRSVKDGVLIKWLCNSPNQQEVQAGKTGQGQGCIQPVMDTYGVLE